MGVGAALGPQLGGRSGFLGLVGHEIPLVLWASGFSLPCSPPLQGGWETCCGESLTAAPASHQAQLIHDRNTASHSVVATRTQAPSTPDKVQMTWTKEKLIAEKFKNKDASMSGFKDLFSLKP